MALLLPAVVGVAARLVGALDRLSLLLAPDAVRPSHGVAAACAPRVRLRHARRLGPSTLLHFVNDGADAFDLYLEAGLVLHELGRLRAGATAFAQVPTHAESHVRLHYRDADGRAHCTTFALDEVEEAGC